MDIDLSRYDRQIALPQIDLEGQEKLGRAHVVIVGMGGLGCAVAQSLASIGIGTLTLIDFDKVEKSNLARQPLYSEQDIGKAKVDAAVPILTRLNPAIAIKTRCENIEQIALEQIENASQTISLVLDCTDNARSRLHINRICRDAAVYLVTAAAIRFEGMVMAVPPAPSTPCYECLSKLWPTPDESCVERGIFAPVVSIIGHYQALIGAKTILNLTPPKPGSVQFFDGLNQSWQSLTIQQNPHCTVCSNKNDKTRFKL